VCPQFHLVFRPIANIRLLYKIFAHMILHRIEATLDMEQPEEQKWFSGRTADGRTCVHYKFDVG